MPNMRDIIDTLRNSGEIEGEVAPLYSREELIAAGDRAASAIETFIQMLADSNRLDRESGAAMQDTVDHIRGWQELFRVNSDRHFTG
jgi:hypothetical protein